MVSMYATATNFQRKKRRLTTYVILHCLVYMLIALINGRNSLSQVFIVLVASLFYIMIYSLSKKPRLLCRYYVTYCFGTFLVIFLSREISRISNPFPSMVFIPKLGELIGEVSLATSGDSSIIVGPYGAVLSPYLNSLEASLIYGGVSSALQDFEPYVTGDNFSIIMPCRDEDAYIEKTIKFVVDNTPENMLGEIIVIDDASKIPVKSYIYKNLSQRYAKKLKVYRFDAKQGLIRSRIYGVDHSTSENILFLDAHCRPKPNWLPPLSLQLKANYKRLATPTIEDINNVTWEFKGSQGTKMMFQWTFEFDWYDDPNDEVALSAGGILAMTRKWWVESGKYDDEMLEWGGENLEQSFRVWLCGGEIKAVRDSIVGHIFDRPAKPNPNNELVIQVQKNQKRAALVWLDEYYKYFSRFHVEASDLSIDGSLDTRMQLRQDLKCLPFSWYVKKFRSAFDRSALLADEYRLLTHEHSGLCLDAATQQSPPSNASVILDRCDATKPTQLWMLVAGKRMLFNYGTRMCLTRRFALNILTVESCDWSSTFKGNNIEQFWSFDSENTKHIFSIFMDYATRTGNDNILIPDGIAESPPANCLTYFALDSLLDSKEVHGETAVENKLQTVSIEFCQSVKGFHYDPQAFFWREPLTS